MRWHKLSGCWPPLSPSPSSIFSLPESSKKRSAHKTSSQAATQAKALLSSCSIFTWKQRLFPDPRRRDITSVTLGFLRCSLHLLRARLGLRYYLVGKSQLVNNRHSTH